MSNIISKTKYNHCFTSKVLLFGNEALNFAELMKKRRVGAASLIIKGTGLKTPIKKLSLGK